MNTQNILILPGYYYLYALYADYALGNAFFNGAEDDARMREVMRTVQVIRETMQPYRKSWALRLFTERQSLARFSPHLVNEVLRELRQMVQQLGPPPGWREGRRRPFRAEQQRGAERQDTAPQSKRAKPRIVPRRPAAPRPEPARPPIVAPPILLDRTA